jgi:hypothetical protein
MISQSVISSTGFATSTVADENLTTAKEIISNFKQSQVL